MVEALVRHRFSVEEWQAMGRHGLFDEDARVELIEGEIVEMAAIGARHARGVKTLAHLFHRQLGTGQAIVSVQDPIRLSGRSEPQPDLALLRWRDDFYPSLPTAADTLLVVEMAETSLPADLVKARLYARSGIPQCWIVDLAGERVLALAGPGPDGYGTEDVAGASDELRVDALPGITVAVRAVLGGA